MAVPVLLVGLLLGVKGASNMCEGIAIERDLASEFSQKWDWFPPGFRCSVTWDDGRTVERLTPWRR